MQLLNEVDKISYRNCKAFIPCDALLTAVFVFPDKCIKSKCEYHATIELNGSHTRGQMVLDHMQKNKHNVTVIQSVNEDEFKKVFEWTVTS